MKLSFKPLFLPPGVSSMAIASVFFFLMSVLVKFCRDIPLSQIVLFRGGIAMLICITQLRLLKISPWGKQRKLLIARGFFGTFALILFFSTLTMVPLATAVTIQYLSPIFTTILTVLVLKEKFFKMQSLFFFVSFLGVLIIKGVSNNDITPLLIGVLAAFLAACAYTTIRKIQKNGGEHPLVIIFYFPLVTVPLISPFAYYQWIAPTFNQWLALIGIGITVQFAQYFMTKAYQEGEGPVVSIATYLGLIWASLGGHYLFGEQLEAKTLLGILFILIGVIGNTLFRKAKMTSLTNLTTN